MSDHAPHPTSIAVPAARLQAYVAEIFAAAGCEAEEAARIGRYLVSANLAGHDSHGVIRVPRYVAWLKEGAVRAGQSLTIVQETPSHAVVDGNCGFGQTVGPLAVDLGIVKAKATGLAAIALRRAGHLGRIGDWGERAAEAGLLSLHFVNVAGGELTAPFGGVSRRFATNPICITVPRARGVSLVLDFATSRVAEGKVLVASQGGKKVPDDSLIGPDGTISGDPRLLYGEIEGTHLRDATKGKGALRTFGEHKGSGLAFMCELLAGCLTGGATSGPMPEGPRRITNGMLSLYIDPGHFAGAGFARAVEDYAAYVKAAQPASPGGEVLLPGEPETRTREARLAAGIPLSRETWAAIGATAAELKVPPPSL
ncbi:MAG: malate/lactate/ureidoglycolate dehydrogenase [Acidibrevibacterium sp.]|uniref:malate/lactate/ureidoglycolate dehydrogenase n=1 Tax=Acidibrevibacterium sp. TaxID=2606776 RepID=UPI003D083788